MLELDNNEGITSMCLVKFEGHVVHDSSTLLAVGTAEQMTYFPTSCTAGYIRLYRYSSVINILVNVVLSMHMLLLLNGRKSSLCSSGTNTQ